MIRWIAWGLFVLALAGWALRERSHSRAHQLDAELAGRLAAELAEAVERTQLLSIQLESSEQQRQRTGVELADAGDRILNLEAQRDHLKGALEGRLRELADAQTATLELRAALERQGMELLRAEAEPRSLRLQLAALQADLSAREQRLTELAAALHGAPPLYTVLGKAANGRALAVEGNPLPGRSLPHPVLLASGNRLLGQGVLLQAQPDWTIVRGREGFHLPSTLVKGEKVIILPLESHEAAHP